MFNDTLPPDPRELPLLTAAERASRLPSAGSNAQVVIFDPTSPHTMFYRMTLTEFIASLTIAGATLTSPTLTSPTLSGAAKLGSSDTRTGAGAVSVTTIHTEVVTTGANALTLADGVDGQVKVITMKTDGGDGTLTPTTKTGYSTITFNDAGDTVTLLFKSGVGWLITGSYGVTIA